MRVLLERAFGTCWPPLRRAENVLVVIVVVVLLPINVVVITALRCEVAIYLEIIHFLDTLCC